MAAFCSLEASTCMMSEWISWSPCSASCGMGMRSRERYVKQFPEDGSSCTLPTEETEKCAVNEDCCKLYICVVFMFYGHSVPNNYPKIYTSDVRHVYVCVLAPSSCVVTEWGEWEPCSVSCGVGMRRRERMMKMEASDGSPCRAQLAEAEKCMMPECSKYEAMKCQFTQLNPTTSHGPGKMPCFTRLDSLPEFLFGASRFLIRPACHLLRVGLHQPFIKSHLN